MERIGTDFKSIVPRVGQVLLLDDYSCYGPLVTTVATANDLVPANHSPGKDNAHYSCQSQLPHQSSNSETSAITFQSFRLSSVFAKGLLPPGLYTSGEVIFAVYTGGATLSHMRSPGLSRRWADNALSVAVEAAYRATIDRLFHPARRIKSVSAPPSLNQAWAKECRN